MVIHLLRDYQTQNISNGSTRIFTYSYILSIFLRRVLSYSYVGDTNFNINSVGSLLVATGDITPTASATFPVGNKAGINLGTQKEFYVSIPASVRTVSGTDIGRLLVLKSTAYPRHNSGVFVITGFETATNSYVIDYRTLGDHPPVETSDSIQWWLYEKETSCPAQGAPNSLKATTEYRSDGNSTTPRIILQSPHALGWQVRICNESTGDVSNSTVVAPNCPQISVSPGFGGNSSGDYVTFGQHFHAPMWFNNSSSIFLGGAPGFHDGSTATGIQFRITICGDDTGQGVTMYCRRPANALSPDSQIVSFGLAENEPSPLPINPQARLFVIGSPGGTAGASPITNDGMLLVNHQTSWGSSVRGCVGMSAFPFGTPCVCSSSFWTYVTGNTQGNGPMADTFAIDSPFVNATELLPIDLIQGTLGSWGGASTNAYSIAPRIMGTIPHLRAGRTNFGDFSPTTDAARSYQHLRRGLYIPWNGPNMIP